MIWSRQLVMLPFVTMLWHSLHICHASQLHTGILLLGGTGDLARKYLWQALFNAYMKQENTDGELQYTFSIVAGASSHANVAFARLKDIFDNNVICSDAHGSFTICSSKKGEFYDSVSYFQLIGAEDYQAMCKSLENSFSQFSKDTEKKMIIYLAVPPRVFLPALKNIKASCKISELGVSVKVVLEKPQGRNLKSADELSDELLGMFEEHQLFRVDHYLAKSLVTTILPFRAANPQLERILNRDHVERVEIFLKETVGVEGNKLKKEQTKKGEYCMKSLNQLSRFWMLQAHDLQPMGIPGQPVLLARSPSALLCKEFVGPLQEWGLYSQERFGFYNDVGVIRDVFQNHLTQLLTLVTLDLPANLSTSTTSVQEAKVRLLRQIPRVTSQGLLLGQYASYAYEAARELPDSNVTSLVPTFAAALVKVQSPRWADVPFILVSGKKMDERSSYIRIVFKPNRICVSGCHDDYHLGEGAGHAYRSEVDASEVTLSGKGGQSPYSSPKQLVFQIGHGGVGKPLISVSTSLGKPTWPDCLQETFDSEVFGTLKKYHGASPDAFFHATPVSQTDAYTTVLDDALQDRRERFISTSELLLAWRIWDQVIEPSPNRPPRIYDAGDPAALLNFEVKGGRLAYTAEDRDQDAGEKTTLHLQHLQTPASFLGHRLVSGTRESLALHLAREIETAAEADIMSKGVFHVAFSGGTSPILLWQALAHSFASENWANIHVWQVDERCVHPAGDSRSNLFHLDRHLLRLAGVPWSHVHTMPVDLAGRICDPELQGARLYSDSIRKHVMNLQMDFILLGLGEDGHTASLFPRSPTLSADSETLVVLTDSGPKDTPSRMTMTLPLINRAKRVAFLVMGSQKHAVLEKLEKAHSRTGIVDELPALGVNPVNGTLTWYIDYDALLANHYEEIKR